jgi:hypothetical protein
LEDWILDNFWFIGSCYLIFVIYSSYSSKSSYSSNSSKTIGIWVGAAQDYCMYSKVIDLTNQAVDIINMDNSANPLEYLNTLDCINLVGRIN